MGARAGRTTVPAHSRTCTRSPGTRVCRGAPTRLAAAVPPGVRTAARRGSRPTRAATATTPGPSRSIRTTLTGGTSRQAPGPYAAHGGGDPQARIYRRRAAEPWRPLAGGLPEPLSAMPSSSTASSRAWSRPRLRSPRTSSRPTWEPGRSASRHRYGRPPALASYRGQVNALRSFYAYLERLDLLADSRGRPLANPMRTIACPPTPQAENDWLRPGEDAALLACPGSLQERFTVALLRHTGPRVSEASSLTLAELVLEPGQETLLVRRSKTAAGSRSVPILPALLPTLTDWLAELERQA